VLKEITYHNAGRYVELIETPLERMTATLIVELRNELHELVADSFTVDFHRLIYRPLKVSFLFISISSIYRLMIYSIIMD
jgi:hypothetical protein